MLAGRTHNVPAGEAGASQVQPHAFLRHALVEGAKLRERPRVRAQAQPPAAARVDLLEQLCEFEGVHLAVLRRCDGGARLQWRQRADA
jgi:hypothetical protein